MAEDPIQEQHGQDQHAEGDPDRQLEPKRALKKHPAMKAFMKVASKSAMLYGQADRTDVDEPVRHRHDEFEHASEEDLAGFEVESDSEGHHYAVRRSHPELQAQAEAEDAGAPPPYRDWNRKPKLVSE